MGLAANETTLFGFLVDHEVGSLGPQTETRTDLSDGKPSYPEPAACENDNGTSFQLASQFFQVRDDEGRLLVRRDRI